MSENFIKSAFQDPWRWRRVAVTSVVCVTSMGSPLAKETSSTEKHQHPEKIRDLHFHIKYKLGQNYFSPLEIQEYAGRMVKAELRESRVLHMTGHSLGSQTSTVVIQLEQDINTLHNTQGIKAKIHWGSRRQMTPRMFYHVSTEREYKRGTTNNTERNVVPLATNSCLIPQKDLFPMLFTNHKDLAVFIK